MELMLVLVEFARANNESEIKSTRAKSVITSKIERVKLGEKVWFGVQKPSWIVGFKDGEFILDKEKVKLVKNIFACYLAGQSCSKIANNLNESKTPTLRNFKDGIWTNSTVANLLNNKNCIGWFFINDVEIDDYFPAIIDYKVFQLTQNKLAFNTKDRGGSKYGFVRNMFKVLLFCSECGQTIETKISSYKNVKGTVNHYADYICRGVKNKNGCKNKGRVSVSELETKLFQSILNLDDFNKQPQPTNKRLHELENKLAKVQLSISRYMTLLESNELADMGELTTNLGRLNKDKVQLVKDIELEKLKSSKLSNSPKVMELLRDTLKDLEIENKDELIKKYGHYKEVSEDEMLKIIAGGNKPLYQLQNTETRKRIKNMLPSVIESIRITFGDNSCVADCQLVNGSKVKVELILAKSFQK